MILSWIKGYHLPRIRNIPQRDFASSISMSGADCLVVQHEINRLLEIGAVEQCQPVAGQFVSSVFLIKKSSGKKRLIFNLKKLNTFLYASHFKMEDKNTAIRLLFPFRKIWTGGRVAFQQHVILLFHIESFIAKFFPMPQMLVGAPVVMALLQMGNKTLKKKNFILIGLSYWQPFTVYNVLRQI